jgi:hypothetical protein
MCLGGILDQASPARPIHFNHETQQTTWFSGLRLWFGCRQSGVAPFHDRTKRLGVSDSGIVVARRCSAVRAHWDAVLPPAVINPDLFMGA